MEIADKPYTVMEVAEYLKTGKQKVYGLIKKGKLKAADISLGNERPIWRITKEQLEEYINS